MPISFLEVESQVFIKPRCFRVLFVDGDGVGTEMGHDVFKKCALDAVSEIIGIDEEHFNAVVLNADEGGRRFVVGVRGQKDRDASDGLRYVGRGLLFRRRTKSDALFGLSATRAR